MKIGDRVIVYNTATDESEFATITRIYNEDIYRYEQYTSKGMAIPEFDDPKYNDVLVDIRWEKTGKISKAYFEWAIGKAAQ